MCITNLCLMMPSIVMKTESKTENEDDVVDDDDDETKYALCNVLWPVSYIAASECCIRNSLIHIICALTAAQWCMYINNSISSSSSRYSMCVNMYMCVV